MVPVPILGVMAGRVSYHIKCIAEYESYKPNSSFNALDILQKLHGTGKLWSLWNLYMFVEGADVSFANFGNA